MNMSKRADSRTQEPRDVIGFIPLADILWIGLSKVSMNLEFGAMPVRNREKDQSISKLDRRRSCVPQIVSSWILQVVTWPLESINTSSVRNLGAAYTSK